MTQTLAYELNNVGAKQEALTIKNKSTKLLSFSDRANQYRKHLLEDDNLVRANKPKNATDKTAIAGEKAQKLLAVFRGKFRNSRKELILNDNYIAQITGRKKRQNINIINQIPDSEFIINRDRKRKSYVITKAKNEESSLQKIAKSERPQSLKTKELQGNSNKNNNTKSIRSYMHMHEAKFFNNSNSNNNLPEQVETTEIKKQNTEFADIKVLVSKNKSLANKRKKITNSERVTRYQKFKAYDKPKSLAEHYPISQEDCYELQERSGKAYNLNAMNEILLDMSRKPELERHSFISKAKFMAYMTKAYQEEGRDADKANQPGFRIMKRRPKSEVEEIITIAQREKYLNETENSGIHTRCDYTQYRARIAGQFPINLAYTLLTNMVEVKREEHVLKITMHKLVPLGENYAHLLLNHAKGIGGYAGVNELEFVGIASNSNITSKLSRNCESQTAATSQSTVVPNLVQREEPQLPQGNWGKVCTAFVSEYGFDLYRYWLAGLEVTEDSEKGDIELRTSSSMVRDRIEQTYLPFLSKVAREIGINRIELLG